MLTAKNTANAAAERFEDALKVAQDRLTFYCTGEARETAATGGIPAQELLSSLCWALCMLSNTAEEAMRTKHAATSGSEQRASDQLGRAQQALSNAERELAAASAERDALREESRQLGTRIRKDGLATRRRQASDAARIVALTEEAQNLQASLRLSESAWAEERRAEHAASAQRECNFQSVIVRLQHEVDALSAAAAESQAAGVANRGAAPQAPANAAASDPALSEELNAARGRVTELQAQCDRGVSLIERLKLRLEKTEKSREVATRRTEELQASLRSAEQKATQQKAKAEAAVAKLQSRSAKSGSEERALADRHASEIRILVEEIDTLEGVCVAQKVAATRAQHATPQWEALTVTEEASAARAASAVASSGTVALLKAALSESQRRLQTTQKALDTAAGDLSDLKSARAAAFAREGVADTKSKVSGDDMAHGVNGAAMDSRQGDSAIAAGRSTRLSTPQNLLAPVPAAETTASADQPMVDSRPRRESSRGILRTPNQPTDGTPMSGLGRLRMDLLSSLRAERSKLERERALLEG